MSIIQEALKKAQNNTKDRTQTRDFFQSKKDETFSRPVPNKASIASKDKIAVKNNINLRSILVAIFAFLLVAVFMQHLLERTSGNKIGDREKNTPAAIAPQQDITYRPISDAEIPKPIASSKNPYGEIRPRPRYPNLVLSGIMLLEDGPRAIINDAIVGVGDTVSGTSVMRIDNRSVVLKYNDTEITLNLK